MGITKRIRRLWELSGRELIGEEQLFADKQPHAEFIMPNRVAEILKENPNATIDQVL